MSGSKRKLIRIVVCLAAFAVAFSCKIAFEARMPWWGWLIVFFAVYVGIGYDVLFRAARNIVHGQVLDENFLMCVATIGAFALGIYRGVSGLSAEGFDEGCAVLLFYQVGEWFQSYATGKSRASISSLMDIRPDCAYVERDGSIVKVSPEEVGIGEIAVVNAGERIALDGVIVGGATSLDTKALTGESMPRDVCEGDEVLSGCVNLHSQIRVRTTKAFYDSTASKILDLVENASAKKSKAENFITKFAKYYTPAVVIVALILAIVPGAVTGDWTTWVYRALSFLVVSCPCALVISIPLSFFAGLGAASRHGILVKGSNYLEKFNRANTFVFDKTGTLTKGDFSVVKVSPQAAEQEILRLAAIAENGSSHPIARAIAGAFGGEPDAGYVPTVVAGEGVSAAYGDDVILCGNARLMARHGVEFVEENGAGTVVYVARNGKFVGSILIADEIKEESRRVVGELNGMGCKTVMLTGDNERVAAGVAEQIGLTDFKAGLLPADKVQEVDGLLAEKNKRDVLCFVGDGINDAPVIMRSDVGIAMGGVGSDAAIEASDIVLMKDDLRALPLAKRIAKKTMAIVFQNIVFSIAVKIAILVLSALGIANMWIAVFGDVGVAVLAILNAIRCLKVNDKFVMRDESVIGNV